MFLFTLEQILIYCFIFLLLNILLFFRNLENFHIHVAKARLYFRFLSPYNKIDVIFIAFHFFTTFFCAAHPHGRLRGFKADYDSVEDEHVGNNTIYHLQSVLHVYEKNGSVECKTPITVSSFPFVNF